MVTKMKEVKMDFKFNEETKLYDVDAFKNMNSFYIVSKGDDVKDSDFANVIQIIDESGDTVDCTQDKFMEIFDQEGLAGFIL